MRIHMATITKIPVYQPCVAVDIVSESDNMSVVEDELELGVWVPDTSELFEKTSKRRSAWLPPKLKNES